MLVIQALHQDDPSLVKAFEQTERSFQWRFAHIRKSRLPERRPAAFKIAPNIWYIWPSVEGGRRDEE